MVMPVSLDPPECPWCGADAIACTTVEGRRVWFCAPCGQVRFADMDTWDAWMQDLLASGADNPTGVQA